MDKQLAPDWPRNSDGWILWPDNGSPPELELRRRYFTEAAVKHPAKANIIMIRDLIEYLTEPLETILDPMAGTGTILLAAILGRNIICVDVEEGYHEIQQEGLTKISSILHATNPVFVGDMLLLHGDCKKFLPIPCNAIIFSPPYAGIMKKQKKADDDWGGDITGDLYGYTREEFSRYSSSKDNVGIFSRFNYNQSMEKIYKLLFQSLSPGGTMTVIIKDYISAGKRVELGMPLVRMCYGVGFELFEWHKRLAGGSPFVKIRRAAGEPTVDSEDIIILRKPYNE